MRDGLFAALVITAWVLETGADGLQVGTPPRGVLGRFGETSLPAGAEADRLARVDAEGVLRWAGDPGEVALLGVNYYAPFTVDYAEIGRLGLDHRQVIRDDVAHFRRLGLGCIRLHCFDREFSDAEGNFIDNRHVELLDFLIDECRRSGIYTVLTPIAWWGGSYAPGSTHGFSDRYDMPQMTTDRQAWALQARFLKQFAEHVNRHTGKRYADDPAVLAFECINEPLYPKGTPDSLVTEYINTLADALRASGTTKPVYYNSWQGRNAAAGAARIDGVTGSTYPTGLASGRALKGPQLNRARGSSLQPDAAIARKSRMIYEFDAADVPGSHMYPPMAKFFRSEGVQVASQFQYDPLPLAPENRNWMTHHLNLVYTPGKALSLAIAAEVFKRVPRGTPFGILPAAADFPPFRSSAEADLSEMVTAEAYLTSNATDTQPPKPGELTRVWGCGRSPVVATGGSGAYFLDRAAPGVWRLQLYPDVFTVADPYSGTGETKVRVISGARAMTLRLPDLGDAFAVYPFNGQTAGERLAKAKKGAFAVPPGDYLLARKSGLPKESVLKLVADVAPRYAAPQADAGTEPLLRAEVPAQWRAGYPLVLRAEAVYASNVTARLTLADGTVRTAPMSPTNETGYVAQIPGEALTPGIWRVTFRATGARGVTEYPDAKTLDIRWFPIPGTAVPLLRVPEKIGASAGIDFVKHGVRTAEVTVVEGRLPGSRAAHLKVEGVGENSVAGYTLPFPAGAGALDAAHAGLRVVARGGANGAKIELGFRMKNGQGLGCTPRIGAGWGETVVPVSELSPLWGLPSAKAFRWQDAAHVSVLTGAWLLKQEGVDRQVADLESVEWVRLEPALPLAVVDGAMAWSLFDAEAWLRAPVWFNEFHRWRVTDSLGHTAVHLGVDSFGGTHESVSLRVPCIAPPPVGRDGSPNRPRPPRGGGPTADDGERAVLTVRVRAACPRTTAFELVLIESGGVPWGTNVPLTPEWQTVRIPVSSLRLFTQWGKEYAALAGPHLRLSRLETVSICFGKWLFREAANEPHAIEIAEIGVAESQ